MSEACGVGYIRSDLHNAELTALREAVRVLGEEVASRIQLEQATANVAAMPIPPLDPSHPLREKLRVLAQAELGALTAMDARNANPIARAEVEKPS